MSFASKAIAVAVLCAVSACGTTIRVRSHPDPAPNMLGYRTYSWMSRTVPTNAGQVEIASLDTRIRAAVDANLSLKGYLQRSLSVPDFLVGYRTATKYKTTESFREFYDYRKSGGELGPQESFGRGFEEASLTLEIIDAKTRQVVWRAVAASVIGEKGGGERVSEAVRLMLEKLPPAQ
jgi:hypothetical protein